MALWVLSRTSITVLVINVIWNPLNFPVDGRVSLYTSFLDNDFWPCDWLFTKKKWILHLMVSTFANTVIVYKYISAQKQLLWFCLPYSVIEKKNKGKSWICMPYHFLTWLNWIIAQAFCSKVISNNLQHCYNTHCKTLHVDAAKTP